MNIEDLDISNPGRKRKCCGACGSFDHTSRRCPINVEYAGNNCTVLYLYKYLFKGNKKMKALIVAMNNLSEHILATEISMYVRGRVIGAMCMKVIRID